MDFNKFIKKVYTLAYWLTGDEGMADDMVTLAVSKNANYIRENDIDSSILHITAREVCSIFLMQHDKYNNRISNHKGTHIQKALLTLEPLSRTTLVWRDMLGYNINDLVIVSNFTKEELYQELNVARKQMLESMKASKEKSA